MYQKLVPCCAKKLEEAVVFCRRVLLGRLCVCVYISKYHQGKLMSKAHLKMQDSYPTWNIAET